MEYMHYLWLTLSAILFGGIVFYAKILMNLGASLFEIMLYPNLIVTLALAWFSRKNFRQILAQPLKINGLFLLAMFLVTLGQYAPLFLNVSVSLLVLLLYLQPVWTILIEHFYFHQKADKKTWILLFSMVLGLLILVNPFAIKPSSVAGIFVALMGSIGLSLWVIITKYFSVQNISAASTFWFACLLTVLGCLPFYWLAPANLLSFSLTMTPLLWGNFLFYSLVILSLSNLLLFANNRSVPAGQIGMILLLEPVTSVVLDVIFLHTPLTANLLVGGGIILFSNIFLICYHTRGSGISCK